MTKKCDSNCCDHFFDDYGQDEDDHEIQRLKDVIKICEFLIQSRQHKKDKKKILDDLEEDVKEEKRKEQDSYRDPYRIYAYRWPPTKRYIPYSDRIWF